MGCMEVLIAVEMCMPRATMLRQRDRGFMASRRDQKKKRMGKKHRQASTRPKKGKSPRTGAQMANVAPKKRKALSSKKAAEAKAARTPKQSPERERGVALDAARTERDRSLSKGHGSQLRPEQEREPELANERAKQRCGSGGAGSRHGEREDRELETLASELIRRVTVASSMPRRMCRWWRSAAGRTWASRRCSTALRGRGGRLWATSRGLRATASTARRSGPGAWRARRYGRRGAG